MAFAESAPVPRKRVVAVSCRKRHVRGEESDDEFELLDVEPALDRRLAVLLVLRRLDDVVFQGHGEQYTTPSKGGRAALYFFLLFFYFAH